MPWGTRTLKIRMQAQRRLLACPLRMSDLEGRGNWDDPAQGQAGILSD